jgi:Tol biopolymer transport system component
MDVFWVDVETGETRRVSVATDASEANNWSGRIVNSIGLDISADGRYAVFQSAASNLVVGDTNGATDIFMHDVDTGVTTRVSLADDDSQPSGHSYYPTISSNGRYVAFRSTATNLLPVADANGSDYDIFVRDLVAGTTEIVSIDSAGIQGNANSDFPAISGDGNRVVFLSKANNLVPNDTNGAAGVSTGEDVFVHDRTTRTTSRVSVASGGAEHAGGLTYHPTISSDGRVIAFASSASDLISGDTNTRFDIFVHDLMTGTTDRASEAADGTESNDHSNYPAVSASGRFLIFQSTASNLVPGDTNGRRDIIMRDLQSGDVTRLNLKNDGSQTSRDADRLPAISADGRFVHFSTGSEAFAPDAAGALLISYLVETGAPPETPAVPTLGTFAYGILVMSLLTTAVWGASIRWRSL